jgi:hypothetical protein
LATQATKRKSGIPTGNAGEYFVMGELLRRGFDAQLADRNTKGYDMLVGSTENASLRKVQVKTVRAQPWYVSLASFKGKNRRQVTVYVLLGSLECKKAVRYFIAKNQDVAKRIHVPKGWKKHAFMPMTAVEQFENRWKTLLT